MKTLISFIGSNDGGTLIGKNDDGAILTMLKERKFDSVVLLYNINGKAKGTDREFSYKEISEHIKSEIIINKCCPLENIKIEVMNFDDIIDHAEIYPKLLNYLETNFSSERVKDSELYAGISSGTPAMQTSWVLIAESDAFPMKLLRSVEKRYAKNKKRVFDVDLLTGTKEKLDKLKTYETKLGFKSKSSFFTIEDTMNLSDKQLQIAISEQHILIYGETGVGKEVLAKTIHEASSRQKFALIPLNCASMPEQLLESELFGHIKGAFTGAFNTKKGIVEEHSKGTLFLDEINSMPLSVQTKLLRFLESGEYRRLGSNNIEKSNIRVIAAANEKIQKLVAEGKFREDLFYRLRTFELFIPPLRDRQELIPELIKRLSSELLFNSEALEELLIHKFSGNIRELKIILERLKLYAKSNKVDKKMVKVVLNDLKSESQISDIEIPKELEGKAYKLIRNMLTNAALNQTHGNTLAAAKILGVTHPSIKKWSEDDNN